MVPLSDHFKTKNLFFFGKLFETFKEARQSNDIPHCQSVDNTPYIMDMMGTWENEPCTARQSLQPVLFSSSVCVNITVQCPVQQAASA